MGLMAMLEEVLNGEVATATVATPATHKPENDPTVATVARVAVARAGNQQIEPADVDPPEVTPTVARVATVAVASPQKSEIKRPALKLVSTTDAPTECEARLHGKRVQAFQSKGIADHQAITLATRLIRRDRQLDDRRSCAECDSFYSGRCKRHLSPIGESTIQTLHRCKGFTA